MQKKILSNFIFKRFEKKSENIFISQNRKNLKFFDFVFCKFEISKSEISKSEKYFLKMEKYIKNQKRKKIRFSILENENIFWKFSKLLKIKFDNIFFAYSWNLNLHHVIQSPAMNSAWPVTIFRLFEFQLQQIFTHNEWSFSRTSKSVKSSKNTKNLETYMDRLTELVDASCRWV